MKRKKAKKLRRRLVAAIATNVRLHHTLCSERAKIESLMRCEKLGQSRLTALMDDGWMISCGKSGLNRYDATAVRIGFEPRRCCGTTIGEAWSGLIEALGVDASKTAIDNAE